MNRITAKEAQALTQAALVETEVEKVLSDIMERVETEARGGKSLLKYRDNGFGDSCVYGTSWPIINRCVVAELHKLGYRADVRSDERQFVDIWLQVEW